MKPLSEILIDEELQKVEELKKHFNKKLLRYYELLDVPRNKDKKEIEKHSADLSKTLSEIRALEIFVSPEEIENGFK